MISFSLNSNGTMANDMTSAVETEFTLMARIKHLDNVIIALDDNVDAFMDQLNCRRTLDILRNYRHLSGLPCYFKATIKSYYCDTLDAMLQGEDNDFLVLDPGVDINKIQAFREITEAAMLTQDLINRKKYASLIVVTEIIGDYPVLLNKNSG